MKKGKVILALALLVGTPILTYGLSLTMEKRYTAQVRLLVDQAGQRFDNPGPLAQLDDISSLSKPRSSSTQVQIMTGTEVLSAALQRAREQMPNKLSSNESVSNAYEGLLRRLQVDSDPMSDVIGLRVTQTDPELAAEVANDIAYAYIDYMTQLSKQTGTSLLTALTTQVDAAKKELDGIDNQIAGYKEKARVADINASSASATSNAAQSQLQLDQAESQYTGAVSELAEAKRLLAQTPKKVVASTNTQANPVLVSLQQDRTRLLTQYADLRSKYTDAHPDVKAMGQQIRDNLSQIKKERSMISGGASTQVNPSWQTQYANVNNLQARADGLRSSLETLRASTRAVQSQIDALPVLEQKINGLTRRRDVILANYQQLEQRRSITQATGVSRQPNIQVVSTALVPSVASFPDSRLFILAGVAVGAFLSILILMPRQDPPAPDYLPNVYATPAAPAPVAGASHGPELDMP